MNDAPNNIEKKKRDHRNERNPHYGHIMSQESRDRISKSQSERYDMIQCELGSRYFLRRGGQGEINHEENGVNRQWASVDDIDILNRLTPFAKVGG